MGESWVRVRDAARDGTLRASDDGAQVVAARWEQLVEYLCLHLSQELGVDVKQIKPRSRTARDRVSESAHSLADTGVIEREIKVPDAVGPVRIEADLKARLVTTSIDLAAPKDMKMPKTKVNWLLRQLKEAPDDLRIEVRFASSRQTTSELLGDCRDDPDCMLNPDDPKRDPRGFTLARTLPMAKKGGLDPGSFAAGLRKQTTEFYRDLVQDLMPPQPKAPKLPSDKEQQQPPENERGRGGSETEARKRHSEGLSDLAELDSGGLLDSA